MNRFDKKIIVMIAFMLLGILIAAQFRTTLNYNRQKSLSVIGVEELTEQLNAEKETRELLLKREKELTNEKENYLKAVIDSKNSNFLKDQKEYLDNIKLKAGLTDVSGPGIIVRLNDAPAKQSDNASLYIIHDNDIWLVLNELKKAGAQAISVNDERIISTSEQICAGPTIRINKNKYPVPYTIKAVGNPDSLEKAIEGSEIVFLMRKYGIRVRVEKSKEVLILKYGNNPNKLTTGLEVEKK